MIKRIELWNFESHEHTVLDNISPGLNLLCGESNSGKTSIVRALKLAAYNEFDPRSVRVGATKCTVLVETERGSVKVTRGEKNNLWEVTKVGQQTQYFDKVGKNIVPDAEEIIGLKIVTLGDVSVPVNIMDQLESHFMLKGIGDKDASGSMRAQIVDEISGLSGIEGLIKDVSLDHHRFGREIKETEKTMEAVRLQLHPETVLNLEEGVLGKAETDLKDRDTMLGLVDHGDTIVSEASSVRQGILLLERGLAAIPDTVQAMKEVTRADAAGSKASSASTLHQSGVAVSSGIKDLEKKLMAIPDTSFALGTLTLVDTGVKLTEEAWNLHTAGATATAKIVVLKDSLVKIPDGQAAACLLNEAEIKNQLRGKMMEVLGKWDAVRLNVNEKSDRDKVIEKALDSVDLVQKASSALSLLTDAQGLLTLAEGVMAGIDDVNSKILDYTLSVQVAEKNRDELLASVTTCPLSLRPVSKECLA